MSSIERRIFYPRFARQVGGVDTIRLKPPKFNPPTTMLLALVVFQAGIGILSLARGRGMGPGTYMTLGLFLFVFASFAGWWVEISSEEISLVKFFVFRKSVQRSDITGWEIRTGWKRGSRVDVPYRRIEIYVGKKSEAFVIPTKPLKRDDIQRLIACLPPKR
jgi:hypothetical protein